jgi:hypothetical protein
LILLERNWDFRKTWCHVSYDYLFDERVRVRFSGVPKEGAMFFRIKKSGTRGYVQVVENKRIDGEARQSVIATLRHSDELAASGASTATATKTRGLTDR